MQGIDNLSDILEFLGGRDAGGSKLIATIVVYVMAGCLSTKLVMNGCS